jgi:hypothetical protein
MMEVVRTSETSVYFNETTRHSIPQGSHLQTRRRENHKSHVAYELMIRYVAPTRHCKGNEVQRESRPTSAVYKLKKAYGSGDEYSKAK